MKILHIIDSMDMGGAQSLIVELAPVQKEFGHEVDVLQLVDSADRTFINKLEDNGINVFAVSKQRPVRSIINIFSIIPYLKKYELVHVHLFPAQYWAVFAKILSVCKTPIVTTEHSTDNYRRKYFFLRYVDSFVYNRYQSIIACSDKAKETFKEYLKNIDCVSIPNGVNISKYINAKSYSKADLLKIPEESFVITMVARFVPPKRQDVLVRALTYLPDNYHAVFVGGDNKDEGLALIRKLAKDLLIEHRVHFLYVRPDVPRILKSSDVIVMASDFEGLSLSSIEGMASGHPFVASDVNGLREVVEGAGVLVDNGDYKGLAVELERLCEDKTYCEEVTRRCIERASQFDIRLVAKKYLDVYSQLVK